MQITAVPILLNMTMPNHLYETLRLMSAFVYWHIPAWEEVSQYEPPTLPFNISVSELHLVSDQRPKYMF